MNVPVHNPSGWTREDLLWPVLLKDARLTGGHQLLAEHPERLLDLTELVGTSTRNAVSSATARWSSMARWTVVESRPRRSLEPVGSTPRDAMGAPLLSTAPLS